MSTIDDKRARDLLRDLVDVLQRIERCPVCIQPLGDDAVEACHRGHYESALRRARVYLASFPAPKN